MAIIPAVHDQWTFLLVGHESNTPHEQQKRCRMTRYAVIWPRGELELSNFESLVAATVLWETAHNRTDWAKTAQVSDYTYDWKCGMPRTVSQVKYTVCIPFEIKLTKVWYCPVFDIIGLNHAGWMTMSSCISQNYDNWRFWLNWSISCLTSSVSK